MVKFLGCYNTTPLKKKSRPRDLLRAALLGAKCARGFAISARGRVVVVVCLLSWCCVNKNLCREEVYAAATQGKPHFRIYRE